MQEKLVHWPESACTAARVWERIGGPDGPPEAANDVTALEPVPEYVTPYPFMLEPGYDTNAFAHWEAAAMAATGADKARLYLFMSECTPQVNEDGSTAAYWCFPQGVEDLGDTPPGVDLSHPAYGTLRRIAWRYRSERNEDRSIRLDVAMQQVADRVKARAGVLAADVDRVMQCLKADRCGCDRCRYGY